MVPHDVISLGTHNGDGNGYLPGITAPVTSSRHLRQYCVKAGKTALVMLYSIDVNMDKATVDTTHAIFAYVVGLLFRMQTWMACLHSTFYIIV